MRLPLDLTAFERTLITQRKGAESYQPFWISPSQAVVLAAQLQGAPYKDVELDLFLANSNTADADIKDTVIHLAGTTFHATLLLFQHGRDYESKCPIGLALALAVRANAPILIDEALFDRAGVCLSATPSEPHR